MSSLYNLIPTETTNNNYPKPMRERCDDVMPHKEKAAGDVMGSVNNVIILSI